MNYTVPAGKTVASGDIVVVGDTAAVAVTDGAEGETIALAKEGVYELPKGSGAIDQGKKVYVNVSEAGVATIVTTASGNTLCGTAHEAATAAATTVLVRLS